MTELNDKELAMVKNGQAAEALLSSPVIASAINELSEGLANIIILSNPEDAEKRERAYFLHLALRELVAILNHRIALKDNIEAQMVDEENE